MKIKTSFPTITTLDFSISNDPELQVAVQSRELVKEAEKLILWLASEVHSNRISDEIDIPYGFWIIRLKREGSFRSVWERNLGDSNYHRGADLTLRCLIDQQKVCGKYKATFQPPHVHQMVVISKGVYEGLPVQGVRYPSPPHMSGWWITTDLYDGDIKSLKTDHIHHLTDKRFDLTPYIALPFGFRFDFSTHEDVWFEQEVAESAGE